MHSASGADSSSPPRVTVIVRSFNRLEALAELLDALLAQDHDSYEIVVVEQTEDSSPEAVANLAPRFADGRVRVVSRPPLGGPGARNEGVRQAHGGIVVFIDDDDLPIGTGWISGHERHFSDPTVVGVTGRHVRRIGEACPYIALLRPLIRRRCLSYSWLKTPYMFARFDEDVDGVRWLAGTNSALRKEVALRAGLWDESVRTQDEHSFAFKLHRVLAPDERLLFRQEPALLRRLDIPGGLEKRRITVVDQLVSPLRYVHQVLRRYFPMRVRALYPVYIFWAMYRTVLWIWNAAPIGSPAARLRATLTVPFHLPAARRKALQSEAPVEVDTVGAD